MDNAKALHPVLSSSLFHFHLTEEETEAQRGQLWSPGSRGE